MNSKQPFLGSALLLAGTTIGAGMLALPLASSNLGFWPMLLIMAFMWALMTYSALVMLEVNLCTQPGATLFTMARQTLGREGQLLALAATLFLFYALTAAYIAGGASLLHDYIQSLTATDLPQGYTTLGFTLLAGGFVYTSTRMVDLANRVLFTLKIAAFITVMLFLAPHVDSRQLHQLPAEQGLLLAALPIVFTSFGFHGSIPSLIAYQKGQNAATAPLLRRIMLVGSAIPLGIYILWEIATLGVVPVNELQQVVAAGGSVGELIGALGQAAGDSNWISNSLHIFSDLALITSFLGVTLGLFDFIAEASRRSDCRRGRLQTAFLTFVPPLLFALFYPKGFITALGYAAIALAILAIILPVAMCVKVRRQNHDGYRVAGGSAALILSFAIGSALVLIQLAASFGLIAGF